MERFKGPLTQIIATDSAWRIHIDPVSGKRCDAAGEVGRRPTKARAIRKHIPQDLANGDDSSAARHGGVSTFHMQINETPSFTERQQNELVSEPSSCWRGAQTPDHASIPRITFVKKGISDPAKSCCYFAVSRVAFSPDSWEGYRLE